MILDKQTSKELQQGSELAFTAVFDAYHHYLYVIAYRYLKSSTEAEDAIQFTFLRLWETRSSINPEASLKNLLFTILKHYILNEIRHRTLVYEKHYELAQSNPDYQEDFTAALEDRNIKEHIIDLIETLPPQKRKICLLKIVDGLSNQEIAETMNISIATVKSHYTQAIKILRSQMDKLITIIITGIIGI